MKRVLVVVTLLLACNAISAAAAQAGAASPAENAAAAASPSPAPAAPLLLAAPAALSTQASSCALSQLPALNPAPSPRIVQCGQCSDTGCQGASFGEFCAYRNGAYYYCNIITGGRCSTGGWDCTCWTGPIP